MKLAKLVPEYVLPIDIANIQVTGLTLDSRDVQNGDVFIALQGENVDGRQFIRSAIASGAVAVFAEAEKFSYEQHASIPIINIPSLSQSVSRFAGVFYGEPANSLDVIGVTGTNGKSTCVALLAQASQLLGKNSWQVGTVGYGAAQVAKQDVVSKPFNETGLTTPDAISCQRILSEASKQAEFVAMEVSSHAAVQNRVSGIRFKAGVFTNITRDHLDYHGTFEAYREAKLSFLRDSSLQFAVVNYDDDFGREICEKKPIGSAKCVSFSIGNDKADAWASIESLTVEGIEADFFSPWGDGKICTSLVGEFNLSNVLAVICVFCESGYALADVLLAVSQLQGVEGRLQKVTTDSSAVLPQVFIDYAHTPDALEKALRAIKHLSPAELWVVFGCGGDRDVGKRAQMAEIAEALANRVVVTSDNPRSEAPQNIINDIISGFANADIADIFIDRKQAIDFSIATMPEDGCLLVAGKGHEKYQIIGDQRYPFDDYEVALEALEQRKVRGETLQ